MYKIKNIMQAEMNRNELPEAYVVMYSVIDKNSFQRAEDDLARLQVVLYAILLISNN